MRTFAWGLVGYATVLMLSVGCDPVADNPKDVDDSGVSVPDEHDASGQTSADAGSQTSADAGGQTSADAGSQTSADAAPTDPSPGTGVACGSKTCPAGDICCSPSCGICGTKGGACPAIACLLDAGKPSSCASTTCPHGTYCDDITGTAECHTAPSCDTVKCAAGTTCELVDVQCIRAPCPPQPQCVASTTHACNLACIQGTHCVVTNGTPSCVPSSDAGSDAGVACGKNTCGAGQKCCSASCGICGTAKGLCPAIACAPEI